jgi:C1A family cysteine protease
MNKVQRKYGWRPDLPDQRDHLYAAMRKAFGPLPVRIDLRSGCSQVEMQGGVGSCTANAIVGCLEFLEIKATKTWVDLSRLYLYYKEREMEGSINEDAGAYIRDGIKVLVKTGTPHEDIWPYDESKWKTKPSAKADAEAGQHKITSYERLNSLRDMKECLASGYPFVFGFSVYDSFESDAVAKTGRVPLPSNSERVVGGHAVMAVGYDDEQGHMIVRNSWGVGWGDNGYFYMPYEFLTNRNLSDDFWVLKK